MRKWFILFIISFLPFFAGAETVKVGDLWYNLEDTAPVATVVSSQDGISYSGDIVIPASIEYGGTTFTVTSIGENAFNSCSELNSVVISEGVQTIETSAFMQCYNMKWVELPSSITTIGYWAFSFCSNLHYVISKIEDPSDIDKTNFFCQNSVVDSVEVFGPSSAVLYVPAGTRSKYQAHVGWDIFPVIFEGERQEIKVGDLKYAYATASQEAVVIKDDYLTLESVSIPASVPIDGVDYTVKAIGNSAFSSCIRLSSVTFNEGLTFISKEAFWSCNHIEFSSLPSTIKVIGSGALQSCGITKLVIPEGCTAIDASAFAWCGSLRKVELPSTINYIGERAFIGASELNSVVSHIARPFAIARNVFCKEENWDSGNSTVTQSDAILYVPSGTKANYQEFDGWNMFADIVEGDLKEVKVGNLNYSYVLGGNTATVIEGDYSDLSEIIIPSTVSIDDNTYSVEVIGDRAFIGYYYLKSVTLNEGLKIIGSCAFQDCSSAEFNNIPSTITSIGYNAFAGCNGLTKVVLSNCISIDHDAFQCCNGLKWLELPSSLRTLSENAFAYCGNMEVVVSYLTTPIDIDKSVFQKNKYVNGEWTQEKSDATLYVPVNTKSAYQAIEGWNMFADIIEGDPKEVTDDGLNYIYLESSKTAKVVEGEYSSMSTVVIPASITIDGESYTVNAIDKKAFAGGGYISKLELPSTITSIGDRAFIGINTMVVSHIQTPFSVPKSAFAGSERWDEASQDNVFSKTEAKLYVPVGTRSSYLSTSGWDMFTEENVIEGEPKEAKVGDLTYSYLLGKSTATVIAADYSKLNKVIIPGSVAIEGSSYNVTEIGTGAFQGYLGIDTLIIEQGVQTIGKDAFRDCNNLRHVSFSEGLKTIGESAFQNIGSWYRNPVKITIPSTVTSIGDYAFAGIYNLSSVSSKIQTPFTISESVFCSGWNYDDNGRQTFEKTSANLFVPEGTASEYQKYDGWKMFAGIYEGELMEATVGPLKYTYLPSNLRATVISGDYSNLEEITIPSTVEIGGNVYQVKEIGSGAFSSCWKIQSIKIEEGIEIIGKEAFQSCNSAKFGELPYSITSIGDYAFQYCNGITSLVLPSSLQTIGEQAFYSCDNLQQVVLPYSLSNIGSLAFANCRNLTIVTSRIQDPINIPDNVFVTTSYEGGYSESASAATLCVPEGTKSRYQAIKGWTMFREILEGEMLQAEVAPLTYIYNVSSGQAYVTKGSNYSELRNVTIPGTVTIDGAKYSVTAVGARAFSSTNITSVTIEEGVKSIEQEAFYWCSQLTKITLPSSLEEIKVNAFTECSSLTSIEIPANVSLIREKAFSFCRKLSSIKVSADNRVYDSRNNCNAIIETATNTLNTGCKTTVIPESVTAIGPDAFAGSQFTEITIPSGVKTIGDEAFLCCDQFSEIVIPEGVESIGTSCFHSCYTMETIELPNSLKTLSAWSLGNCTGLVNLVTYIENPYEIPDYVFGDDQKVFERAKLYVPKGKKSTYQRTECWSLFKDVEEMIGGTMSVPTVKYNGRYLTLASAEDGRIYYSLDGTTPILQYKDTLTCYDLATVKAIAKRFGSVTSDTLNYKIDYVYDGVTAKTAEGGLLAKCFEWSGTDKVEMLDIDGTLNDDDFGTIRGLSKLKTLNMAASKMTSGSIPAGAFANTKLQWYVSPYTLTSVGANAFRGCDQLSAITWNSSSVELPEDVATDVANPNMLVYAKSLAMIPYALKNVVINGVANNITLADSTGNNNFYCPEEFKARRISYTHNYQQKTARGVTQGWETLALPFTVSKITHETKGEITPSTVEGAERPFWLYELGDNGLKAATQISANIPYLICMPNDDAYGDDYILGGRVTFSAQNVTITTSTGTVVSSGDRQFVPTYQSVASSSDVYVLNVGQVVGDNPAGSAFVQNLREVRPFEAYSMHGASRSRTIPVSSLRGGDATGINDLMLNDGGDPVDGVVKVYSLSGALIKQGKREEVLRNLPKGLYIIDGKKIIK